MLDNVVNMGVLTIIITALVFRTSNKFVILGNYGGRKKI